MGHEPSVSAFGRPFRSAADAYAAMLGARNQQVADCETVVCLGDATVDGQVLGQHREGWREAPGAKWLVLANHDRAVKALRKAGFTSQPRLILSATGPLLALSHEPLGLLAGGRGQCARPPSRRNRSPRANQSP